jgi:fructose-bisphosphate aldolase class I
MKPIPALDALLDQAVRLGIFGTKMRSVIDLPSKKGISALAMQQFDVAAQIAGYGLMPIIEPEVSIKSPDKAGAEAILLTELVPGIGARTRAFLLTCRRTLTYTRRIRCSDLQLG